jgi:hypothetical protein
MIEVQILIPVADNDGVFFTPRHDGVYEDALVVLFGGFTGPTAALGGAWRDKDGRVWRDRNRAYVVFVHGLVDRSPQILAAINFAKQHYRQLAITIRYLDHAEIL